MKSLGFQFVASDVIFQQLTRGVPVFLFTAEHSSLKSGNKYRKNFYFNTSLPQSFTGAIPDPSCNNNKRSTVVRKKRKRYKKYRIWSKFYISVRESTTVLLHLHVHLRLESLM